MAGFSAADVLYHIRIAGIGGHALVCNVTPILVGACSKLLELRPMILEDVSIAPCRIATVLRPTAAEHVIGDSILHEETYQLAWVRTCTAGTPGRSGLSGARTFGFCGLELGNTCGSGNCYSRQIGRVVRGYGLRVSLPKAKRRTSGHHECKNQN